MPGNPINFYIIILHYITSWRAMARSMERADNVEESHFMERTWAALLSRSRPLASSEPKTHVFLAGAWVDLLSQPHAAPTHAVCRVTLADHVRLLLLLFQLIRMLIKVLNCPRYVIPNPCLNRAPVAFGMGCRGSPFSSLTADRPRRPTPSPLPRRSATKA